MLWVDLPAFVHAAVPGVAVVAPPRNVHLPLLAPAKCPRRHPADGLHNGKLI